MDLEAGTTRNLSIYKYLQVLQVEYMVTELRKKIYVKRKDKDFYRRVLEGKERKIKDICLRNSLPSLFESEEIKSSCYSLVYNPLGYPDFHYKNEEQVQEYKAKDFYFYYYRGSEFKVQTDEGIVVGILHSVDEESQVAKLKLKGKEKVSIHSLDSIARII